MTQFAYIDASGVAHACVTEPSDGRFGYTKCFVAVVPMDIANTTKAFVLDDTDALQKAVTAVKQRCVQDTSITCIRCLGAKA